MLYGMLRRVQTGRLGPGILAASSHRAFIVRVGRPRGGSFEREAVIQPTQEATLGFIVLEWNAPFGSDIPPPPPAVSVPQCFGDIF
jgi:hypothetical protein